MKKPEVSSYMPYRFFIVTLALILLPGSLGAERISDISHTSHNLSASGRGMVMASNETRICVFCHTPHYAENIPAAPLWNRSLSGESYTIYTSNSLDTIGMDQPDGSSKLCLSCHDGTLAIGAVNVLNGVLSPGVINMYGVGTGGVMPGGDGEQTGFTRNLGVNLTNDHPVSIIYDTDLSTRDGELRDPASSSHIGIRQAGTGTRPLVPLEPVPAPYGEPKLQCVSCHDPHIRDDTVEYSIKFLRLNRFQKSPPVGGSFDAQGDIICIACHDKAGWAGSAHANINVADEQYEDTAAVLRGFPTGLLVWEAACLNCHDSHTVQGARRLLREGTDSLESPKSGGGSAIEETCYQCHSVLGESILNFVSSVPNIKDDFSLSYRMPITSNDQPAVEEVHDIKDADFTEDTAELGLGNLNNRHVECTDCHNPHRVIKNRMFNDDPNMPDTAGTHAHSGVNHTNIISGVLAGIWGVEPVYPGSTTFGTEPESFLIKKGYAGVGAGTALEHDWVTREYQICLKCHSNHAYSIAPYLDESGGGTPSGTNGMVQYTNQAMEFRAPSGDKGEGSGIHRSWHPVMDNTGRTLAVRDMAASSWRDPWDNDVGNQTMYCTDCHGSNSATGDVIPPGGEDGDPWGPHGSGNYFLLKGEWSPNTGFTSSSGATSSNALCFKCHNTSAFTDSNPAVSGFSGSVMMGTENLHNLHLQNIGRLKCMWCHTAVPHGWANKALLVNLNDVGQSVGPYTNPPYYYNAMLKVTTFATSSSWSDGNCGGRNWMRSNCSSPP